MLALFLFTGTFLFTKLSKSKLPKVQIKGCEILSKVQFLTDKIRKKVTKKNLNLILLNLLCLSAWGRRFWQLFEYSGAIRSSGGEQFSAC